MVSYAIPDRPGWLRKELAHAQAIADIELVYERRINYLSRWMWTVDYPLLFFFFFCFCVLYFAGLLLVLQYINILMFLYFYLCVCDCVC